MTRWVRHGRVFAPGPGSPAWASSHGANPFAVPSEDGWRVLFSPRDEANRSSVAAVTWRPPEAARLETEVLLEPGPAGAFDQHGVSVGCLVDGGTRLYYLGWNLDGEQAFSNSIGLAELQEDGSFHRLDAGPVLGRSEVDPWTVSYPWVLRIGDGYRMWYGSTTRWHDGGLDMDHVLRTARSSDGLHWTPDPEPCLTPSFDGEWALSRPCVQRRGDDWRMWFSARGERYRIGYAESSDGVRWHRDDAAWGLEADPGSAWESEEVTYPCVVAHRGRLVLFYCGNGYGRTGFGWASAADPWQA